MAIVSTTRLMSVLRVYFAGLALASVTAGPAEGDKRLASGASQPHRNLKANFHVDFRTSDYDPEFLLPWGQGELFRDEKGLLLSGGNTGLYCDFSIRGDFEITLSFEVLKADPPKSGPGVGPALRATTVENHANGVLLARRLLPDGTTVFFSDRLQTVNGKTTHEVKNLPSKATKGKLRLERVGTLVRCRVSEGEDANFLTVAEMEFGRRDVYQLFVFGSEGESAGRLEARLFDLTVRAEALPGVSDHPSGDSGVRRLDAKQAAELDARLQKLYARLAPSVVRIVNPTRGDNTGPSGVIISPSGEILTTAHHGLAPKTKVLVQLADGRKVKGAILGSVKLDSTPRYPATDVGMALLDGIDDWPAVTLGRSGDAKVGDLCLAIGQPIVHMPGQPPLLRLGRILASNSFGEIRHTCRTQWGDSGGPLFDFEGRVLGVSMAMESLGRGIHVSSPIEGFLKVRDQLRVAEQPSLEIDYPEKIERRKEKGGAWGPTADLRKILSAAHKNTVEVSGDGKVVALGVIVHRDGWILTKYSELFGPGGLRRLACRFADGANLEARVMGQSREHDLALLKVAATDLPAVQWANAGGPLIGQLIASFGVNPEQVHCGVVGALNAKNPANKAYLPITIASAPEGVRGTVFTNFQPAHRQVDEARSLLKAGDVITHLDDIPTVSADEFTRVRDKRLAAPDTLAGDWLKLTIQRDAKIFTAFLQLVDNPPNEGWVKNSLIWKQARWNLRRNGFPSIFCHDSGIAYDRCGGPVVNRLGQVIGINIARPDPGRTFAIPSDVVQRIIAELKAQTQN